MDLNQRVRSLVARCLSVDIEDVKEDTNIIDELGGDSLDAVEVMLAAEEEFKVNIPTSEEEFLMTPANLTAWLRKNGVTD